MSRNMILGFLRLENLSCYTSLMVVKITARVENIYVLHATKNSWKKEEKKKTKTRNHSTWILIWAKELEIKDNWRN